LSASGEVNSSSDYYYLKNTLKDLLLARSVKRGDFVLSSGRRSSFYVDARLTTMSGDGLAVIGGSGSIVWPSGAGVPAPSAVSRSAPIPSPMRSR